MFNFKSKKRLKMEQELKEARRQIEEEKKKARAIREEEKKKTQAIREEADRLKSLILKKESDIEDLYNLIELERYRQEDELRMELEESEFQITLQERFSRFQDIKDRFRLDRMEVRKALKTYKDKERERTRERTKGRTEERGLSR